MWVLISIDDMLSVNVVMVSSYKYIIENKKRMLEEENGDGRIGYHIRQAEEYEITFKG